MKAFIEELDYQRTPLGELVLRRRKSPSLEGAVVYEVKLDNEMLMSSSVNFSEKALADFAIRSYTNERCDVLLGGLGLGYTAEAVLQYPQVDRLDVVELLTPVIGWHRSGLVPASQRLMNDTRCNLIEGDFFEHVGPTASGSTQQYDVILADIDHSPHSWLHSRHQEFYTGQGLAVLKQHLRSGGIFGLWSADQPHEEFRGTLASVFSLVEVKPVDFFNPHIGDNDSNWIILSSCR
jgi:spermidine synthase